MDTKCSCIRHNKGICKEDTSSTYSSFPSLPKHLPVPLSWPRSARCCRPHYGRIVLGLASYCRCYQQMSHDVHRSSWRCFSLSVSLLLYPWRGAFPRLGPPSSANKEVLVSLGGSGVLSSAMVNILCEE